VRGVTIVAGGLTVGAASETSYTARSLDSENIVSGSTAATIDASVITAGAGGLTVTATDASRFIAIALPFQPRLDPGVAYPTIQVARVSIINIVAKSTTATISNSTVNSAGDVTVSASNETSLLAYSSSAPTGQDTTTDPAEAKNAVAGILAANVVNGDVSATVSTSNVTVTADADLVVAASDDSFIDATIYMSVDGNGAVGLGMASSNGVSALEALNVIGFNVGATAAGLAKASLDVLLGTQFWTAETPVKVNASIVDSVVLVAGAVAVTADSRGVANTTVSNASRNVGEGGILASTAKSIAAVLSSNQISRSAMATIDGGTVDAVGSIDVRAWDDSTVNSNTKISTAALASSDGGLHALEDYFAEGQQTDSDRTLTDGLTNVVPYGTTVTLNYDKKTDGYTGSIDVATGDIVYVARLGSAGALYKYVGTGPDANRTINFEQGDAAADLSDDSYWIEIPGVEGNTYTYLGADNPALDLTDPSMVDFTDPDLWKPELDYSVLSGGLNLRGTGAMSIGAAIVFNDVRGGAKALVTDTVVHAADVTVKADSTGTIMAVADVLSVVEAGSPFAQDDLVGKALGKVGGFLLKAGEPGGQSAIVATNLIQGETSAKIVDATIGTIADKVGDVVVNAENRSLISSENSTVSSVTGVSAGAFQIANNTIGWERGNFLFNTVETLLGDVVADVAGQVG